MSRQQEHRIDRLAFIANLKMQVRSLSPSALAAKILAIACAAPTLLFCSESGIACVNRS